MSAPLKLKIDCKRLNQIHKKEHNSENFTGPKSHYQIAESIQGQKPPTWSSSPMIVTHLCDASILSNLYCMALVS